MAVSANGGNKLVGWDNYKGHQAVMHGWFFETHIRVFSYAIKKLRPKVILELGSWYGASTKWLAENTDDNVKIYAIDLWDNKFILEDQADHYHVESNKPGAKAVAKMLHENDLYQTFMANLHPHREKLTPIRMDTVQGVHWLKRQGIVPDMIYVDADHHYEAAKKDITACCECFPDAVLCGDDYGNYDDVSRAVKECAIAFNKELHVDANHCWIYMDVKTNIYGENIQLREKKKTKFGALLSKFSKKKDKKQSAAEEVSSSSSSTTSNNKEETSTTGTATAVAASVEENEKRGHDKTLEAALTTIESKEAGNEAQPTKKSKPSKE